MNGSVMMDGMGSCGEELAAALMSHPHDISSTLEARLIFPFCSSFWATFPMRCIFHFPFSLLLSLCLARPYPTLFQEASSSVLFRFNFSAAHEASSFELFCFCFWVCHGTAHSLFTFSFYFYFYFFSKTKDKIENYVCCSTSDGATTS